jgi:hypothetical protein
MAEEEAINYFSNPINHENELPDELRKLLSFAFSLNCHLDESSMTLEEKETLSNLDIGEVFENLKDLIVDLLNFKQKFKSSNIAELAVRSNQFETIIQKLEAKVRAQIGVEQQLKLHIENTQSQYEELEKINSQLKKGSSASYQEKNLCEKHEIEIKTLKEKISDSDKDHKKKEVDYTRLVTENFKLKKMLDDKNRQINLMRREIKPRGEYLESNDYIKKQIEEQNSEILKIQQRLKKNVYGWSPKKNIRQKSSKRTGSPVNETQYVSPAFKIAQKYIRGHIRSFSEH